MAARRAEPLSSASGSAIGFAQRQTLGQKRPPDPLAQALGLAATPLPAQGSMEPHPKGTLRAGSALHPGSTGLSLSALVTTLLDPQAYPAEDLARLYARRWRIELWFRDLKTSLGMEVLRCKSPKMLHKELEMFFIAYNLIRCLMAEASEIY